MKKLYLISYFWVRVVGFLILCILVLIGELIKCLFAIIVFGIIFSLTMLVSSVIEKPKRNRYFWHLS